MKDVKVHIEMTLEAKGPFSLGDVEEALRRAAPGEFAVKSLAPTGEGRQRMTLSYDMTHLN